MGLLMWPKVFSPYAKIGTVICSDAMAQLSLAQALEPITMVLSHPEWL